MLLPRMWNRKRLIFCGSGSTLMKEAGSGSELGSKSIKKELEAEAFSSKSGAFGFLNSETVGVTTVGVKCNNNEIIFRYITMLATFPV